MKNEILYMFYVKAEDCFDDDNEGFIYGIEFVNNPHKDNEEVLHCEWFKTEEARHEYALNEKQENGCKFPTK